MKKPYFVITTLLVIVISLSIGKAFLQNTLSTSGIFVSHAEQEINFYKTQNAILSEELLTASSLANITEKAEQAGFTGKNTIMILNASQPLAAKP